MTRARRRADWGVHDELGTGETFQALELRRGTIPVGSGVVRYAPGLALAASR